MHSTVAPASSSTAMPVGSASPAPAPADRRPAACRTPRAPPPRRAGVPGADQRRRRAVAHQLGGHANRRARLAAQRPRAGDSAMPMTSGASTTRHVERRGVRMPSQLGTDGVGAPDEVDGEAEMTGRPPGRRRRWAGRMIAAHRVDGDAHAARCLFFVDGANLALAVVAAVRAHAVRGLRLAALRAGARRGRLQRVVRAALAAAGLGVSAFWIRHRRWFAEKRAPAARPAGDRPSAARSRSARH